MKDTTEEFLSGIGEIDEILSAMGFRRHSLRRLGLACFVEFKRRETVVEFLFGPPEWHVEMIIHTLHGKHTLADLLNVPRILEWADETDDSEPSLQDAKDELLWYVRLLKFALPIIAGGALNTHD